MEETLQTTAFAKSEDETGANRFGRTSRLSLHAVKREGQTILSDVSFTAPYKVMTPFRRPDGGIQVMPLCASAGLMRGDRQELSYTVDSGAVLEVLSQSYDKIHKMEGGSASRSITAKVSSNAVLYCSPQPVIPFAGSAFDSGTVIHLEDETSRLYFLEILCCGRNAYHEQFAYRRFASKVEILRGGHLIYRDNTCYEPAVMPMRSLGLYEGYTHLANLFLSKPDPELQERIWSLIGEEHLDGGVTRLSDGDLAVRLFADRAQPLEQAAEKIKALFTGTRQI